MFTSEIIRKASILTMMMAWFLPLAPLYARLGIAIDTNRSTYVRYERIKMIVTIANHTGNRISFTDDEQQQNHLTFRISNNEGRSFDEINSTAPLMGLVLKPGETRQVQIVANQLYDFHEAGKYLIEAQIGHVRLSNDYRSQKHVLTVRDGITLWSRDIGVPVQEESGRIPLRQIELMQVHQQDKDIYCLRIEDEERVYGVLRLGKVIHGDGPQCKTDGISNIHVLLRLESRLYVYRVYDYRGKQLQVEYYMLTASKPELYRSSEDGTVTVVGGRPAIQGEDYILTDEGANPAGELPSTIRRRPTPDL